MPLPITGNWQLATDHATTSCSNASSTGPKKAHSEKRQTNSPANLRKRCDAMRNVNNFQISLEWERKVADNVEEERLKEADSDKESLRGVLERKREIAGKGEIRGGWEMS